MNLPENGVTVFLARSIIWIGIAGGIAAAAAIGGPMVPEHMCPSHRLSMCDQAAIDLPHIDTPDMPGPSPGRFVKAQTATPTVAPGRNFR